MDHFKKYFIFLSFFLTMQAFTSVKIIAQSSPDNTISGSLPQLKQITADMNQSVLSLLTLIHEYEKSIPLSTYEVVRIIKLETVVRETYNESAPVLLRVRMNEEYPITERRDNWYRIRTDDNREGWLPEEDIQLITKQTVDADRDVVGTSGIEMSLLLGQISRNKIRIDELYASATLIILQIEDRYESLGDERKDEVASDYKSAMDYKEKIEKYYSYATRFFEPYKGIVPDTEGAVPSKVLPGDRFKGTASADIGRSTYQNVNSNATYSRKFAFNGTYEINNMTRANAAIQHQNELMQTQYTTTSVNAGITTKLAGKLDLGGKMGYNDYSDKETGNNSYGQFNTGANISYEPSASARLFGNLGLRNKAFRNISDNNYTGFMYATGVSFTHNPQKNLTLQLAGNVQLSEADYLNFNQINPRIIYTNNSSETRSFNFALDFDRIAYGATNNANDYQKISTDFQWRNKKEKTTLTRKLYGALKLHPFNNRQDYVRIGFTADKRKGSLRENKSSNTAFTTILNIYTQREDMFLADYLDIRFDNSKTGNRSFLTFNIFNRLWNNLEKTDSTKIDHVMDVYFNVGPYFRNNSPAQVKLSNLKIGLILGGHIAYNVDERFFIRNGNSLRAGIMAAGTIRIYSASIGFSGTYERSLITAVVPLDPATEVIDFDNILLRKPSSFQFKIDYRQPVYKNWDIHFNLSTYDIRTDATKETSYNPVDRRSNLRVFGGVVYRFAL